MSSYPGKLPEAMSNSARRGEIKQFAAKMGVHPNRVQDAGGVAKLEALEPHIQRLLLGISHKFNE